MGNVGFEGKTGIRLGSCPVWCVISAFSAVSPPFAIEGAEKLNVGTGGFGGKILGFGLELVEDAAPLFCEIGEVVGLVEGTGGMADGVAFVGSTRPDVPFLCGFESKLSSFAFSPATGIGESIGGLISLP